MGASMELINKSAEVFIQRPYGKDYQVTLGNEIIDCCCYLTL